MPKLKEIFELPEHVSSGDFVLKLTDGLSAPAETVRQYVPTPQLVRCFDQALGVVKSALDSRTSKGAYLHGSFGAGKSHFMAMLSLLLRGDPTARGKPELAPVLSKHNGWTQGKKFLVVPYHMTGFETMEAALFSGYAEYVAQLHPEAAAPGFYQREGILADAKALKVRMGDEAFFQALSEAEGGSSPTGGGWGKVSQVWSSARFEAGLQAPPGSNERYRLVGVLTRAFYAKQSYLSSSEKELYTSLDDGLSALSHHARDLGYDAVLLFLDEFILWLASRSAESAWVARESQKASKLVESANADRPIPIVSFMARQRDLRELVGQHIPGAEQLAQLDTLNFWQARFDTVMLEDRNLPEIAKKRLLVPRGPDQKAQLDGAITRLLAAHPEVLQTLQTREGDQSMLRDLYPFTPALVQTLIAVSSMLQRERTALKLMLQMLVNKGESLEIGDVIPVGDLFDEIADGDEPFTHGIKLFFDQAKQLWRRRLLPILEAQHGFNWEDLEAGRIEARKAAALRNDARLLKTLVLAALVPEVEALKALTPAKLAALNHGTIRTPVPGSEGPTVLNKLKRWAGQAGEIKIADDSANPIIALEIAQVDTDAILENAKGSDSVGNRQAEVRQMIVEGLGLPDNVAHGLFPTLALAWRGSRREAEIVFGNVREQSFDALKGREGTWRILVDFPFDQSPHTPADDIAKIDGFLNDGQVGRAIVWLPSFLSPNTQDQLGRLVVLNFLLRGSNLDQNAQHLSQADREQARMLLSNQRDQLRQFIRNSLHTAYGLSEIARETIDPVHALDEHFYSLDPSLMLRPPVTANFKDAFEKLMEQALDYEFPAHPQFEAEPRPIAVKRLAEVLIAAAQRPGGRIEIDPALRDDARRIAPKLELAEVGEAALQLRDDWSQHFIRQIAQQGQREPTVRELRLWLDLPRARGLRDDLQDLVILTWLAKTNRSLFRSGQAFRGDIGNLPNACEAREQPLPSSEDWEKATKLGGTILDPAMAGLYRSAPGLVEFARLARSRLRDAAYVASYQRAIAAMAKALDATAIAPEHTALRESGATRLRDVLAAIEGCSSDFGLVSVLAGLDFGAEDEAEARAILAKAQELAGMEVNHQLVNSLKTIVAGAGEFAVRAGVLLEQLAHAVLQYEYVTPLNQAVQRFQQDALALITDVANKTTPPVIPPPGGGGKPPPDAGGQKTVHHVEQSRISKEAAVKILAETIATIENLEHPSVDIQIFIRQEE